MGMAVSREGRRFTLAAYHLVLERHALRIVLLDPRLRGLLRSENLQILTLVVDPHGQAGCLCFPVLERPLSASDARESRPRLR